MFIQSFVEQKISQVSNKIIFILIIEINIKKVLKSARIKRT